MMGHSAHKSWDSFDWRRPSEVYGDGNFNLYENVDPNDIFQGYCGDCYYLSSLSSLSEFPERMKAIFLTKEINEAGCYAV